MPSACARRAAQAGSFGCQELAFVGGQVGAIKDFVLRTPKRDSYFKMYCSCHVICVWRSLRSGVCATCPLRYLNLAICEIRVCRHENLLDAKQMARKAQKSTQNLRSFTMVVYVAELLVTRSRPKQIHNAIAGITRTVYECHLSAPKYSP